ncbi:alpha/beta hydrolase [Bradyrhizobium sp. 21]|uniref:alpha/beta hydrolase n=1 Tax=Bradyrhizobium sp. 21 TaxID=2782666 RepID=UPI001FFA07AA|nr:alpha/beta hydrolase [Bradyrhizobium sp. 21]MCK1383597.1 alpha/beta hydrolase [Bradyrhizobium sp. 21]
MTIDDLELQRLAIGNALNQLFYRAAIAANLDKTSKWSRVFNLTQARFADIVRDFTLELPSGVAHDRMVNGLTDVETNDLKAAVAIALTRGSAGIADLFETALSSLAGLLDEIEPQVISPELRIQIETAIGLVRSSVRDVAVAPVVRGGGRATEFNIRRPRPGKGLSKDGGLYEVWFGTNRKPVVEDNVLKGFSGERDTQLHLGRCAVEIPATHRIGSTGSSWWRRLLDGDDRLSLAETVELGDAAFWDEVKQRIAAAELGPADAIVFLHGYNVSFEDAAVRAAQIGADLSLPGLMAFFSWPSRGKLFSYTVDEATIEASEKDITDFLNDFCARSGARAVHLIAHSMGNRGLLRVVQRISERVANQTKRPFGQIILAAADVDVGLFRNLASAYALVGDRTTLYVSAGDRAVLSSRLLHAANRVGLAPPVCVIEGIDTVNATNVDLTELGHGYVASSREVLTDMYTLLASGTPPDKRATLRHATEDGVGIYWEFAR